MIRFDGLKSCDHQLRLVVCPMIQLQYRVLYISGVWGWISPINSTIHVLRIACANFCAFSFRVTFEISRQLFYPRNAFPGSPPGRPPFFNPIGRLRVSPFLIVKVYHHPKPIASMYCIFTYIYHKHQLNAGKYTIHGSSGKGTTISTWWLTSRDSNDN